jgi:hypothetical protein
MDVEVGFPAFWFISVFVYGIEFIGVRHRVIGVG